MEESKERSRFGTLWRTAALILAVILVFHLASPAASAIANGSKQDETIPTTEPATEPAAAMTAIDYMYLAEEAIAVSDYDLAYSQLQEAKTLAQEENESSLIADIWVKMVSIQILQQKYEDAISSIEQFQAKDIPLPDDSLSGVLEFLKGGCLAQLGEHQKAKDAYYLAAEQGYDKAVCLEQIIIACFELGEYEALAATGDVLLTLENVALNDPALVYKEIGISHVYLSQFEKALNYLELANQETGQAQGNGYYRGICLLSLDRTEEAIEAFTASIEENELLAYCYYNRGVCYLNLMDYGKAKADMEKTLELGEEPEMLEAAQAVLEQLP